MAERTIDPTGRRGPVAFLADRAEALGFWAGVVGLLLVVAVAVLDRTAAGADTAALAAAEQRIADLEARESRRGEELATLQAELRILASRVDSLANR